MGCVDRLDQNNNHLRIKTSNKKWYIAIITSLLDAENDEQNKSLYEQELPIFCYESRFLLVCETRRLYKISHFYFFAKIVRFASIVMIFLQTAILVRRTILAKINAKRDSLSTLLCPTRQQGSCWRWRALEQVVDWSRDKWPNSEKQHQGAVLGNTWHRWLEGLGMLDIIWRIFRKTASKMVSI